MSNFNRAIENTLKFEGGLVNNANDPGGVTNYGISLRWAVAEMKSAGDDLADLLDVDDDGDMDADDIRSLDEATAKQIYRIGFWDRYHYDRIVAFPVSEKVFDMTVNMGPRQSHRNLQRALRSVGEKVEDDGLIGPRTRAAVNRAHSACLVAAMRSEQAGFYRMLIARNNSLRKEGIHVPDFRVFKDGWLRRAYA
jgi:lysozyme family protein